ncbi:MAG: hypothetical protein ABSE08_12560 [Syntrophobacteraceae bacterium]|jgi:hypothetical protein
MTKKSKPPRDINQLAAFIVEQATSDPKPDQPEEPQKNQAAVELGRLGGLKGGKARKEKLTPEQRKEIAKIAANARWKKAGKDTGEKP